MITHRDDCRGGGGPDIVYFSSDIHPIVFFLFLFLSFFPANIGNDQLPPSVHPSPVDPKRWCFSRLDQQFYVCATQVRRDDESLAPCTGLAPSHASSFRGGRLSSQERPFHSQALPAGYFGHPGCLLTSQSCNDNGSTDTLDSPVHILSHSDYAVLPRQVTITPFGRQSHSHSTCRLILTYRKVDSESNWHFKYCLELEKQNKESSSIRTRPFWV